MLFYLRIFYDDMSSYAGGAKQEVFHGEGKHELKNGSRDIEFWVNER